MTIRDDVQVGPYAYRVLRLARPSRGAVLIRDRELCVSRREGLRMLALAELAAERTIVVFPVRDERGIPRDLVLADESLKFPAARWSDVRARLGAGRRERHVKREPAGPPPKRRSPARPEAARNALLIPVDAHRTDVERLRRGELDLGYLRVALA
ncbi:hypothetical protein [Dactylosporangium sp. CA-139066]|uniref:hypothetical protein n=1 Tax=Dactylosporangium sp. CA-139066 TaxID=3239930 RepID=UPI003D8F1F27